jgi:hypothetical protein
MEKNQTEKLVTNVSSDVLTDERNCCGGVQSGECSEAHDEASEINGMVDEVKQSVVDEAEVQSGAEVAVMTDDVGDSSGADADSVENSESAINCDTEFGDLSDVVGERVSKSQVEKIDNTKLVYTQADVERLIGEAYLRGRNEAVERKIRQDSSLGLGGRRKDRVGLERYIVGRPSVWQDRNQL